MKIQVTRVSPHQSAKVFAVIMAVMSLFLVIPIGVMFTISPPVAPNGEHIGPPGFVFLLFPLVYLVMGYFMTLIICAIYNLVARLTGGIEFEFRDRDLDLV
ncbi:MAG: hypothetical protein JWL84_2640 [Rhodospirillales bacterium]|jgi:ABC-type Na+ efflux pump permease subunit|nr:hypothetical protein [Rhodospirillales bacterium]